ncbi:MAG: DUF2934 domain-containing protein [Acidobacteriia bacterium]|nr:DUF2934 domain-containing protein [Terriglobia bacterium]
MTRKHHTIYSDPTGAAAAASPVKRRATRTKSSEFSTPEMSSADSKRTAMPETTVAQEAIARLAYSYWEARGFTGGSAQEDWLRAEQEIRDGKAESALA